MGDADGSNEVTWVEFKAACQNINFTGNVAGAWRYLDTDLQGGITLHEYDETSAELLTSFKNWSDSVFGSAALAFKSLDEDGNGTVTSAEFRKACRVLKWNGDAKLLYQCLKPDDERSKSGLVVKDVTFLDAWRAPL